MPEQLRPYLIGAALGMLAAAAVAFLGFPSPPPEGGEATLILPPPAVTPTPAPTPTPTPRPPLVVYVSGQVRRPGVYTLPPGSRLADALKAAGGPAREADLEAVNLAAPLADGVHLRIPAQGERCPPPPVSEGTGLENAPSAGGGGDPAFPIDLNTATAAELEALPRVGPATAARIVAWREEHGPFRRVEDLLEVPGIGPATLERLRPYVRVGP